MKQIIKKIFVFCLFAGIINSADAQRRTGENASPVRRSMPTGITQAPHAPQNIRENSIQRNTSSVNSERRMPVRNFEQRPSTPQQTNVVSNSTRERRLFSRTTEPRNVASANTTPSASNVATSAPQRNFDQQSSLQNQNNVARNNTQRNLSGYQNNNRISSVPRSSNYNSNYRYRDNRNNYNYNRNNYYRANYVYRPVFMYGPTYRTIPRSSISIYFGGSPYYYTNGYYYGYYGGYYEPIFPPFGLRITTLPFGYSRFYIGIDPFFYFNGIYYRQYNDNSYEIVDAPMGATVSSLPKGAKSVVVNGEKLYELNGTYYKADRDAKGRDVYIVVGKNGEINNTTENLQNEPLSSLQNGDVINDLPEGSKVVTINGEKLYVTPDETYLQQEINNGVVQYKVVGK